MKIIPNYDSHTNKLRELLAWNPQNYLDETSEIKIITVTEDQAKLGSHSHPYEEKFLLASGSCTLRLFSKENGYSEQKLSAPCLFTLEPYEEHLFVFDNSAIIIGFLPKQFKPESHIDATHPKIKR